MELKILMTFLFPLRLIWIVALLLTSVPSAQAQDYKTHYDLGMVLYQAQRFEASIPEFKAAYEFDPKPGLLFNIAQAYRKAGKPRDAIAYYDRYLATESRIDIETRKRVDSYLAEARNTLAALELELKQRLSEAKAARDAEPAPALIDLPPPAPPPPQPPPPRKPIYKKWWFWTAIGGGVAVGLGVGLGVGLSAGQANALGKDVPRMTITFQ
jgi:tetratricopeptide (TPR) repeat protein